MKNRLLLPTIVIALSFLFQACSSADDDVIIAGQVIEQGTGNAIRGAVVEITQPANLQATATTDSSGNFSFGVDINESVSITLEIDKQNYEPVSTSFKLAPENNVDDLTIQLASTTDPGDDGDDDDTVGGEAGGPASLELVSISSSSIAIRNTGGDEDSKFTFSVKDSAGRPVAQGYQVDFSIIRGPDGGERINPSNGFTNSEGVVSSAIASGDSAGVVKLEASIDRSDFGFIIRSTPVLVAIGNGFPESENFRIAPVNINFEAWELIASSESSVRPNFIVASLGDYRNNPVLPGTAVDFTTTGGNITASAVTDEEGIAIAELRPDGSRPMGHPRGIAFATVTARTVDINDNYITTETDVLFTSRDPSITLSPSTVDIPSSGSQNFTMTITDVNGYPVAAGSTISVNTSAGTSNTFGTITLGDFTDPDDPNATPRETGHTIFDFTVSDSDDENPTEQEASITITVTLPSGTSKSASFGG